MTAPSQKADRQPLRIVHSEAATSFGGQENRIFKEMMAMREQGHHLEAICQPHAQLASRLRHEGFTVHTLLMDGPINFVKGVIQLRRVLKQGRFDVLNTHSRRDTLLAGTAARLAGTPLIVRTRHLARKPGSLLSYTIIPHRVTTVSQHVRQGLIDRGVPEDYVATVYSPVHLPERVSHSSLRDEIGLAADDIVVGCVAVMRRPKGHRDLIDALAPIIQERQNVRAVFVGGGSTVFEEVKAYIADRGLQDRIYLLGTRNDVPNLLAGFDIFALATHYEASGTVFVEAASAGLPVVGTDVGGVSEMLENGVTGFLVPAHNPPAVTKALLSLIDSPDLRRQMGEAGLRAFRTSGRFSIENLVKNTEACYYRWLAELRKQ